MATIREQYAALTSAERIAYQCLEHEYPVEIACNKLRESGLGIAEMSATMSKLIALYNQSVREFNAWCDSFDPDQLRAEQWDGEPFRNGPDTSF